METVTGRELVGASAGGSTAGGQFIWLKLRIGDTDETVLVEKSRVTGLIAAIATAAGMARSERLRTNPEEEKPGSKDSAFALDLARTAVGGELGDGSVVLDMRVSTQPGQQMNLFLAADSAALIQLAHTCQRGLAMLAVPRPSKKPS